jgi:poly(3-hydroxybutyrate) depolymerase
MKTPFIIFALGATVAMTTLAADDSAHRGVSKFEFQSAGKKVPVWHFAPSNKTSNTPILFVMHGVKRDAERYLNDWVPLARKYSVIIVAPEFTRNDFPKDSDYSQGALLDNQGKPRPREETAFSFIEPIFDQVKVVTGNRSEKYHLYGHSAGAQFVHRFLYFEPEARVKNVVAANAGWWTLPGNRIDFPYGLKGAPGVSDSVLAAVFQRPLVVLLGTKDTDPNDKNLNKSDGAMQQGAHRFARGKYFYEFGQRQAKAQGLKFEWKLDTAPGIGHSDSGMSAFAAEWLFTNR